MIPFPRFLLIVIVLMLPLQTHAQDQSDGTLHVLRPSMSADQEMGELCLEFDHALDLSDRARALSAIHLESDGKQVAITPTNAGLAATSLCLQSLAHRRNYSLTISDLRGANKEKLTGPYKLSFTVPDRRPTLGFSGDPAAGNPVRYQDNDPVLHAINVARARVMLYRIADPAHMADAYRQRMQTTLAPSESLTFARDNGQLIWQGELVFDDSEDSKFANQRVEHPVPLRAAVGTLAPGFYFIAAEDVVPSGKTKTVAKGLAPLAAQWFTRSDLRIGHVRGADGFFVTAEKADASAFVKDARLFILDRDQQILAEAKSDDHGLAFLPLAEDKRDHAAVLIGIMEAGDVDFADASSDQNASDQQTILAGLNAALMADRPFYQPGNMAHLLLTARDVYGRAVLTPGSTIQLLRPDHSLYETLPVPDGKAGVSSLSFLTPATSGLWPIVWQQNDGRVLAQGSLRVTTSDKAPHLDIAADRARLDSGGDLTLTLKSTAAGGTPLPYLNGRVFLQWVQPDSLAGLNDYRFGDGEKRETPSAPIAAFITDTNGMAHLHLTLKVPNDAAALRTAVLHVESDPSMGALDPEPLSLPVKPANYVVGIKPLAPDGKFAENSVARFDIIALDGEGKRRDTNDLQYQIYEEGRSFAWYQTEGRWEYKLLQQRRRVGGAALSIKADDSTLIRWPVIAGAYSLEITDASGNLRARASFNAGWGLLRSNKIEPAHLTLAAPASVTPGNAAKISFTLDHPVAITAVVADDNVRKVFHLMGATGANDIEFTPEENWGNRIRVRVKAEMAGDPAAPPLVGVVELPVHHNTKELTLTVNAPDHVVPGQNIALSITIGPLADQQTALINFIATPMPKEGDQNTELPASVTIKDVESDGNGKATLRFTVPSFSGDLRIKIVASNQDQWGQKELIVPVEPALDTDFSFSSVMQIGDHAHLSLVLKNADAPATSYRYMLGASSGLKITGPAEGSLILPVGARKAIFFDLAAEQSGAKEIKLDLTGPQNFRISHTWPLAVDGDWIFKNRGDLQLDPQQSWSLPVAEKPSKGKVRPKTKQETPSLIFIGPMPLFETPDIIETLLKSEPFTVSEIANWLEAIRLWRSVIVGAGFLPDRVLVARQKKILEHLLARQGSDGGFSNLPGGESDIASTADALAALARTDQTLAKPAIDAAAGWLSQRLANTWFDDKERNLRAASFGALAAAGRLDVAALRYFAETSDGKTLTPLAAAQLAAVLGASGDHDKAAVWLGAVRDRDTPALWPALAENPLVDPHDILPILQKFSDGFVQRKMHDPQILAGFLRALGTLNVRSGNWRASINGDERDHTGIWILMLSEKPAPLSIRNAMDRPLFVKEGEKTDMPTSLPPTNAMMRRIYRLDGHEAPFNELKQGETYLIMLESPWPSKSASGDTLFIHDAPGSGWHISGCALDSAAGAAENWSWIGSLSLTAPVNCEKGTQEIGIVIAGSGNSGGLWRVGYFAQAEQGGIFYSQPASARGLNSDEWIEGSSQRMEIR